MITRLPYWVLTEKQPAFSETESLTAVEMVSRLYGKMQELIDDYNNFASKINSNIDKYETEFNQDVECFKNSITKIVHDYIATLDAKVAHQDRQINETVTYFKDNLKQAVTDLTNDMKDSGELEQALINAFDNLGGRVITLENEINSLDSQVEQIAENDVCNVKVFGAKGDGQTDDTIAIQNAINSNVGKCIYFPKGTYLISQIKLGTGNVLQGEGFNSSVLKSIPNNSITDGLIVRESNESGWKITIKDLSLKGNKENNTNLFDGIYFKSTDSTDLNSLIENVDISEFTRDGLKLINTGEVKVINVKSHMNNGIGFNIETSDCYFTNCTANHNIKEGMKFIYNSNKIIGCKCYYNGIGDGTEIDDRYSKPKKYAGLNLHGGRANVVIGCEFQNNFGSGVEILYQKLSSIINCTILENGIITLNNNLSGVISYENAGVTPYLSEMYIENSQDLHINVVIANERFESNGYTCKYGVNIKNSSGIYVNSTIKDIEINLNSENNTGCQIYVNNMKVNESLNNTLSLKTGYSLPSTLPFTLAKLKDGIVKLNCEIYYPDGNIPTSETVIATLPEGYKPKNDMLLPAFLGASENNGYSIDSFAYCKIYKSGDIAIRKTINDGKTYKHIILDTTILTV